MKLPSNPAKRPTKAPATTRTSTLPICRRDRLKVASRNERPQATTMASTMPWTQSRRIADPYPSPRSGARTAPKPQPTKPDQAHPTMQYQTKSRNDMDHSRSRRTDHGHPISKGADLPSPEKLPKSRRIGIPNDIKSL